MRGLDGRIEDPEDNVAMIKTIPKVLLLLIFMPFFLFGIVLWTPIRKMILG